MSQGEIQYPAGFGLKDIVSYGSTGLVVLDAPSRTIIKKLLDHASTHYIDLERQIYERLAGKGGHNGVLTYHGVCEDGIRLEYPSYHDLKSFNISEQKLEQRRRWVIQIAETLHFIHSAGVIHGDLTSANTFLDDRLNAKVADFAGSSLDRSPLLIESPASYQCPESPLSVKGDIFSFGSLVYEIMTGHEPCHGHNWDEIRRLFASETFLTPRLWAA